LTRRQRRRIDGVSIAAAQARVAELLSDTTLSGTAKAEFREILRLLAQHWARPEPKLE
jgi:hypothetical protein